MKVHRFWMEIVAVGTAAACALALLMAILGALAGVAAAALAKPGPETTERIYEGMVTCSRCGARHSAALGKTAADCARICVSSGAKFALVNGDTTYQLDDPLNLLRNLAGRRARVVALKSGDTIHVSSVSEDATATPQ